MIIFGNERTKSHLFWGRNEVSCEWGRFARFTTAKLATMNDKLFACTYIAPLWLEKTIFFLSQFDLIFSRPSVASVINMFVSNRRKSSNLYEKELKILTFCEYIRPSGIAICMRLSCREHIREERDEKERGTKNKKNNVSFTERRSFGIYQSEK